MQKTVFTHTVSSPGNHGTVTSIFIESVDLLWQDYDLMRLRLYVDGEKTPSVDVPMGFFDKGLLSPWGEGAIGNTGSLGAEYLRIPMPFSKSVELALVSQPARVLRFTPVCRSVKRGCQRKHIISSQVLSLMLVTIRLAHATQVLGAGDLGPHTCNILVHGAEAPGAPPFRMIASSFDSGKEKVVPGSNLTFFNSSNIDQAESSSSVSPFLAAFNVQGQDKSFYKGGITGCANAVCFPLSYNLESFFFAEVSSDVADSAND